jgi:hypothetical protein
MKEGWLNYRLSHMLLHGTCFSSTLLYLVTDKTSPKCQAAWGPLFLEFLQIIGTLLDHIMNV